MKAHVTVDWISHIIGLPMASVNPSQYFRGNDNGKNLVANVKNTYDVIREKWAYVIKTTNDKAVQVAAKMLAMKIMQKNRPSQCTLGVISCPE